jgi:lipopolysaccharide transport system permease protein
MGSVAAASLDGNLYRHLYEGRYRGDERNTVPCVRFLRITAVDIFFKHDFQCRARTDSLSKPALYPNLLTKMYFPREIIPLSYLVASLADFCIASLIMAGLMVHYRVALTWHVLYAIPIVSLLAGFAASIALFFSAVQVRFRDVGLAMPFLLQVWMFTVPVVYSLKSVPERFRGLYLLDPISGLIEGFRVAVIHGGTPDLKTLALSAVIVMTSGPLAYAYFKSSEATMADLI